MVCEAWTPVVENVSNAEGHLERHSGVVALGARGAVLSKAGKPIGVAKGSGVGDDPAAQPQPDGDEAVSRELSRVFLLSIPLPARDESLW